MIAEALAFVAMVVAVAAPLCGHQGQSWPLGGAWRGLSRLRSRSRVSSDTEGVTEPPRPRTAVRSPSWANTQPINEEAA